MHPRWTVAVLSMLFPILTFARLAAGPEKPLAPPLIAPAPFTREMPRVASDGRDFLVVWVDSRVRGREPELRGVRVDAEGVAIDRSSFVIDSRGGRPYGLASDGDGYVVVYQCRRSDRDATCLARIDGATAGVSAGAVIVGAYGGTIAALGDGYLLAYRSDTNPGREAEIRAVAVRPDGTLEGASFFVGSGRYSSPVIASAGDRAFIVWSAYWQLFGRLVSKQEPLGAEQSLTEGVPFTGPRAFHWSIASDGTDFLVAWQQNQGVEDFRYQTDLIARAVSHDGVAAPASSVITREEAWQPDLSWAGSGYIAHYTVLPPQAAPYLISAQAGDVRAVVTDRNGVPTAAAVNWVAHPEDGAMSASAWNGTATLAVWQRLDSAFYNAHAAQIEARLVRQPGNEPEPVTIVSQSVAWQESLAGARIGNRTIMAWDERTGPRQQRKVFIQRLDDEGNPLDGRGVAVAETLHDQLHPALSGSIVAWVEQNKEPLSQPAAIRVRLFEGDGTLSPGPPFELGPAARDTKVSVAVAGRTHLVTWTSPERAIVGVRIFAGVGPIDAQPFVIADSPRPDFDPLVASDGANFFVMWKRGEFSEIEFDEPYSLHAVIVGSSGALLSAPFAVSGDVALNPVLTWNGQSYVAFWLGPHHQEAATLGATFSRNGSRRNTKVLEGPLLPLAAAAFGEDVLLALDVRTDIFSMEENSRMRLLRVDDSLAIVDSLNLYDERVPDSGAVLVPENPDRAILGLHVPFPGEGVSSRVIVRPIDDGPQSPRRRAAR
jgi:hypothetical protein